MSDGNGVPPEVVQAAVEDFRNGDAPATQSQPQPDGANSTKSADPRPTGPGRMRVTTGLPGAPEGILGEVKIDPAGPYTTPVVYRDDLVWCRKCGAAKRYHGHDEEGEE